MLLSINIYTFINISFYYLHLSQALKYNSCWMNEFSFFLNVIRFYSFLSSGTVLSHTDMKKTTLIRLKIHKRPKYYLLITGTLLLFLRLAYPFLHIQSQKFSVALLLFYIIYTPIIYMRTLSLKRIKLSKVSQLENPPSVNKNKPGLRV